MLFENNPALISAFVGFLGVLFIVWNNWRIARKKNAIDELSKLRDSDKYRKAIDVIREMDSNELNFNYLFINCDYKEQKDKRNAVLYVLNTYELICTGIVHKIYDSTIIKNYSQRTMSRVNKKLFPLIDEIRKENNAPNVYVNYTKIMRRWK